MHEDNFPTVAAVVDSSTFKDDFAAAVEDINCIITIYYQIKVIMRKISFPMGK
jgi:hypothetical protein